MRYAQMALAAALLPSAAWAQAGEANGAGARGAENELVAEAIRIADPPELDGRLADSVWVVAPAVHGFTEREPVEGVPAVDDTEVRFAYTDEALYVGARMYGTPAQIRRDVSRHDADSDAEQIVLSFDTFLDRRTAYTFVVTAAGSRIDYLHPGDFEDSRDYSFDPVWEARVVVDAEGWTAEVRIPFSQLRFNPVAEQLWGLNVKRVRPALQRESLWRLVRRDETGWSSRMGELRGIGGIRGSRQVELRPYIASAATLVTGVDPANPFADERAAAMRVGADVKVGIGPNLTLDAAINPDFGQVEADPAVVNLSAFEVFFDERRPFFTEGSRLFNVGNLFYSRRIGARPQGTVDADYASEADHTTILGAAKLTGRLPSGLSVGVLGAVTDEERVRTFDAEAEDFGRAVVEPYTGYGAARLEQQFGADGSIVGLMLTGVGRAVGEHEALAGLLPSSAFAGGIDGRLRWAGGMYDFAWRAAVTHVSGSPAAMLRQQRLSRRYFQRPDATHVEVDPSRTSLTGYVFTLTHSRLGGEHWLWDIDLWAESPGYEPNDLGRLGSTDGVGGFAGITYRETRPGRFYRRYALRLMAEPEWNYGGDWTHAWYGLNAEIQLPSYWGIDLGFDYEPQVFSPSQTRGGPLMRTSGFRGPYLSIDSPEGRRIQGSVSAGGGGVPAGGWSFWVEPSLRYRPEARLELSVEPRWSRNIDPRQYVASREGGGPTTFGGRYIFGRIDRTEVSATIRADFSVNPDLTIEAYLEPFASSGRYERFGELLAPRTFDLREYGADGTTLERTPEGDYRVTDGTAAFTFRDPSFHIRSFRSNVVVRWEWRVGSTVFLVWQQDRFADENPGHPARATDLWHSLGAAGDNYLALKATYWLPW